MGSGGGGGYGRKQEKSKKANLCVFLDFKNPNIKIYYCIADIFPNF